MVRDDVMTASQTEYARPPIINYHALNPAQIAAYDAIASGPRGKVEGPLAIWVLNPELAGKLQELGTYCRFGSSLPPRLSELAIITVGAYWQSDFEWHAHAPIAEKAGIEASIIEAIRLRSIPRFVRSDEAAVYMFVHTMLEHRQAPDPVYQDLVREIGQSGTVDLVGIAGYYCLVCLTLNAFRVPVPDGASPFTDSGQISS